jgi:arabinan endo-1,5-alpha-L-arabinosidase
MKKVKMLNKISLILSVLFLMSTFIVSKPTTVSAATWMITGDIVTHDPGLEKDGTTWWSPATGVGLAMKYSTDGINWRQGIQIFQNELSWWRTYAPKMGANDVWAPDLKYFNGRYWLYYSVSEFGTNNSAIGLMSCTSVNKGDWRDDGLVIYSKSGTTSYNAIDPNLTIDASGNPWLAFGSFFSGLQIVRLDKTTMKPTGTIYNIANRSAVIEAPSIVYNNGYYYLFASVDACCKGASSTYKMVYGRSTSITGPYLDVNDVNMKNGGGTILDAGSDRWKGPGGQHVYKNGSSWVIVNHAYDAQNNGTPVMFMRDLYFDANNWPTFSLPNYTGNYKFANRANGKRLDGLGSSVNGANIGQWSDSPSYNQQWSFVNLGNGYYKIVNRATGKRLDSLGATADGSNLSQWSDSSSYNQQWRIINGDQGYVKIVNRATGKYLDNGGSSADGGIIKMWFNNGSYNQQWQLVPTN